MEFSGLIKPYPSGRRLTEAESSRRLDQKKCASSEPHYQLCVIKLNSTYLESVDKWFGWKGVISAVAVVIFLMFAIAYIGLVEISLSRESDSYSPDGDLVVLISAAIIVLPILLCAAWLLRKESFAYTHYPMRFNRRTRTVHVFRPNGTVLSVPWDKVCFTMGHLAQWNEWEVRGHVLEPDGLTVRETFALSHVDMISAEDADASRSQSSSNDYVRAHWEFVRRYMEEGPQAVSDQVRFCMPIHNNRESFRGGVERVFANISAAPFILYWILFPFCGIVSIFRLFAMRTCKIPQWPDEVEVSCGIDLGDPFAIEGAADGARIAVFPQAAAAAGVGFQPTVRSSELKRAK